MLKMICFINDYKVWDDIIHSHACRYFSKFNIHPNLLLASNETFYEIDKCAHLYRPDAIIKSNGDDKDDNLDIDQDDEIKPIGGFCASNYTIDFHIDEGVKKNYFILSLNEDPPGDGEPFDDLENNS